MNQLRRSMTRCRRGWVRGLWLGGNVATQMRCGISQARRRGYRWRGREQLRAHVMSNGGALAPRWYPAGCGGGKDCVKESETFTDRGPWCYSIGSWSGRGTSRGRGEKGFERHFIVRRIGCQRRGRDEFR